MEFFLSKLVMFSVGFILIGISFSAFSQLDEKVLDRVANSKAQKVAELLYQLNSSPSHSKCCLSFAELALPSDSQLEIANGSVWIKWPGGTAVAACPQNLMIDRGHIVLHPGDQLVMESVFLDDQRYIRLQSEKVEIISLMAAKNLLHSSSVL